MRENVVMQEMNLQEMKQINGGLNPIVEVIKVIALGIGTSFATCFGDIREGFSDGINGKEPRY